MKVLQINTTVNSGSTGRIAENIGKVLINKGHESYIAYGRGNSLSASELIRVGNEWDVIGHGIKSHLFDRHGFGTRKATETLIQQIKEIQPDLIHLHNVHGYYLNIGVLFNYLKFAGLPIVWTLHDCWSFTGHCSYFDFQNCFRWQTVCFNCPNKHAYPKSWLLDNSKNNYQKKKILFTGLDNLLFVTPSQWLSSHLSNSFLEAYPAKVIHNGIDLSVFRPLENEDIRYRYGKGRHKIILGVASIWDRRKGFDAFIQLAKKIDNSDIIILVGLNKKQMKNLPKEIIGIERTENIQELAELYSAADVFINPTWVDNFPTTNIEALACGTPVVTYNTGGSPEAIDQHTGKVVAKGDVAGLWEAVKEILHNGKNIYTVPCRNRAEQLFDGRKRYMDYIELYSQMIDAKKQSSK